MATLFFILVVGFSPAIIGPTSNEFLRLFLLIIFILTFIIPLISIIMLKLTNAIQNYHMPSREERILPFTLIAVYYGVSSYLVIQKLPVNDIVSLILYTKTGLIVLLTIVTLFWKISAHSLSVGGILGFLCAINLSLPESELLYPIVLIAFLCGLVMSARLYLNAHSPPQVYWGAFLGFFLSFSSIILFG